MTSRSSHIIQLIALMALLLTAGAGYASEPVDSVKTSQRNLFERIIDYFRRANKTEVRRRPSFSFIGGPHASSDTGVGLGLVAAGIYSTAPEDTTILPSNVSLFADITTRGFYKIGVRGLHLYRHGDRRIDYELSLNLYSTYFWGIGYDAARRKTNKTKYMLVDMMAEVDHLWRLGNTNFFGGPIAKLNYIGARKIENDRVFSGLDRSHTSFGAGLRLMFDTRDNFTAPTRGWMGEVTQRFYPRFLGNRNLSFSSSEFAINHYQSLWKGGVLASRLHGLFTYGNTPWGLMPSIGGSYTLRGYYEGQYRDKCETDITFELRQHIVGRSGVALWGALGAVYSSFSGFRSRMFLPNVGVGYRWEFKKLTNVRVDVGFGKSNWSFVLNINEAF
ncbi:MAG: BamA/TamA family outer membrane protein [Muribaculaceae bacterium]|nr:BamA/TamA family outer membrane protein [Muribaculaceae bacterium]